MRQLLIEQLAEEGIETLLAESVDVALEALRHQTIDAVLANLSLPGWDRFELLTAIRGLFPSIPVILMTSFGDEEAARRARQAGVFGWLSKPFEASELVPLLERAFRP